MSVYAGPERNVSLQTTSGRSLYSLGVVQDGLVLNLDAGKFYSYPKSGTTWTDLTNNGNTGTLAGGVGYSGLNGGSLSFDGSNDYVFFPSNIVSTLTSVTISSWFYWTDNVAWTRIFDFGINTSFFMLLTPKNGTTNTPRFSISVSFGIEQQITSPSPISTNVWTNITITLNGTTGIMYLNGTSIKSSSISLTPSSLGNTTNNWIGRSQYPDPYYRGNIAQVSIYNRALTAGEIAQNFNATRSRFGI